MDSLLQVVLFIINLLAAFFLTYVIFDFMSKFQRNIYRKRYYYILSYIIFTTILIIIGMFFRSLLLNMVFALIGTVIIGYFLYNNKKICILYYSMFIVIISAFQVIISYIFNIICRTGVINFYSIEIFLVANSIVIQFANLSASRLFLNCYKNKNISKLTKVQFFNFLVLPIFSIFYIVTLMMYIQTYISFEDSLLLIINIVSIIILNIFITDIFQDISKNNEMENQISLYKQQANMQYDYYNSLETKYKNSRKIIHDIKNHIQTIENLYKQKEEEKANYYTKDLYKMFNSLQQTYYTDNKVLNIIINDISERAKDLDITLDCKIGDVSLDFIKDIDLTTIFSNLLDNAIYEVRELKDNKKIFLKVDKFNQFLIINITNSLRSKPVKCNEKFKSTKKNHMGLGLQNVKMAIEKYEGNLRIDFNEEKFKVNIIIPIS